MTGNIRRWAIVFICVSLLTGKADATGFTLTVNVVGSGSVTRNPTNAIYPNGAAVTLTAISNDPTWYFSNWSGDINGTNNPTNVTMNANKVITATFQQFNVFTVTLATNGQGTIALNPAGGIYSSNTTVTVTATPSAGWIFAGWSGSTNGNTNPLSLAVNTNLSLTGTFAQLPAFDVQPQIVTNSIGSTASFSSHSVGTAPINYQWFFGGNFLAGATNTTVSVTNVQLANAGNYFVVAMNSYGNATSSIAALVLTNVGGSTNAVSICNEANLRAAIQAGGWVSINCNGTIALTNTINIANNVILDAQNVSFTISGNNTVRLFYIAPGAALSATNVIFANGCVSNNTADGGGIYNDGGTVTLVSCVLTNNFAESYLSSGSPVGSASLSRGGAIFNRNGIVSLFDSGLYNNMAAGLYSTSLLTWYVYGGAIYSSNGTVKIINCNFSSNLCTSIDPGPSFEDGSAYGGAVFQASGSLLVTNSIFASNQAFGGNGGGLDDIPGPAFGGAFCVIGGIAIVDHSQFLGNIANGDNLAKYPQSGYGGAIYSSSSLIAESCTFAANQALAGNSTVDGSVTGQGGAIYNAGSAILSRCSVFSNSVQGSAGIEYGGFQDEPGGPGLGGGICNTATLTATNCTIALNTAIGGAGSHIGSAAPNGNALGGGIFNSINATSILMNVTIASNCCIASGAGSLHTFSGFSPSNGLAAGVQIANTNGTLRLHNSIIAYGGTNGNAYGTITDDGFNISDDGSANLFGGSSYNFTDPQLGPLDYYTGPTPCMALLSNSPAIDFGDSSGAPDTDQRWSSRPHGDGVDMGAFEFYETNHVVSLKLMNSATALSFMAYPGIIYHLQSSTNLTFWSDVTTFGPFAATTNLTQMLSSQGAGGHFLRLRWP